MTDLSTILGQLTPEQRDLFLSRLSERSAAAPVSRVVPRRGRRSGVEPLSFAQERLWFLEQLEPGNAAYVLTSATRLSGKVEISALMAAAAGMARRHEALRTTFGIEGGRPCQVVAPEGALPLAVVDLNGMAPGRREEEARRLVAQESVRPFSLGGGPLARMILVHFEATEHWLLLSMHHIISDGWSGGIFLRELAALYGGLLRGEPAPLPDPELQYADYAVWQREWLTSEALESQIAYWRERLAGAPLLDLPLDRPRPRLRSPRGRRLLERLPPELSAALAGWSPRQGATLFMTLAAAFATLLNRHSGQDDVVVGSPIANRNRRETEGVVGFFVNLVVLRLDLGGNPRFQALVSRARETLAGAYAHQDLPFEKLVEALEPVRDPMYTPLFQTLLTLQNAPLRFDLAGLELSRIEIEGAAAKYDFSLELLESEEGIGCYWWYSTEVLDPTTVARLARHFAALLAAVVENPERRLAELPLLTPAERHALLAEWNDEPQVYPEGELLHAVFEGWAAHTPEAVALVHERDRLTYGELNARANRLARRLIGWGVRPEARVAIGAERRFEMVVGLLAILKAGGAYVPLDPSYPHERLAAMAAMAAGSGAAILLVDRRHVATLGKLAAWERVVDLDDVAGSSAEKSGDPAPRGLADHPAYVLFTSGSTGLPKGVVVPHRAIGNRLRSHAAADLDPGSRVLQKTTISFDVSLIEIFGPLCAGGASVLARAGGQQDAGYLAQLIVEEGITHLNGPPSLLTALLEQAALCRAGSLRSVVTGSEAVTTELPHRVHAVLAAKLYNRYGPTEATIAVTSWLCERGVAERVLPIGRPIARAEIYLVGRDRRLLPLGATGEVMIGGACLARGYLDRPDLTAESFLPHPFSAEPGARLYRTGDLARRRADGALEFVGRRDGQVKIRGSRVELADVEAALLRHPGVQAAVVVANADGASSQLAAYVVPKNGSTLAPQELRVSLVARLPEYMVPSGFAVLGALPLTPSGKVDRHRLPAVLWQAQAAYVPPQTPAEELMAGIWSRVLRRERVGIEDNFFELGGHSLLATRVISQVREIFGAEVPLRAIFESPTVAGLAAKVELAGNGWRVPTIRPMARPALLPLSFAQERLWFLDQLEPDSARYLIGSVVRLEGDLDRRALGHGLGEIVRRHESLRTVFAVADGQPIQVIQPAAPAALPVVDLASLDADRRECEVRRLSAAEAARPFDLARGPLLRMTLVALRSAPEPEHVALLTLHHIVADGWSMGVLVRELGALYAAAARGTRSALPELPIQYADFALWQRQVLAGDALREELAYWRQALAGLAPLALPTDRPRPPALTSRGGVCRRLLAPELCRGLAAAGRQWDATLFMTLLSTFAVLLHRYAGQDDIAVGSAIANRGRAELEGLIGFFVNTLVLRADCGEDPDYAELVARVRRMALGAFAHQDLPFEKLVEVLQTQRDAGRTPLFQVLLALENTGVERLALPGLTLTMGEPEASPAKFELTLIFKETEQGLAGLWSFPLDLFDAVTVERMAGHYETLLSQVSESGPRPVHLSELSLLGTVERWQLVQEWSERAEDVPRGMTVDRLFAEQAARAPQAVALVSADGEITYGELARRAGRLAARLRGVGVGPEVAVGLCLPRSAAMVVATLAVLQAGGVYVPLDPSYPNGRLAFLLHDARVAVLVTEEPLLAVFGKDGQPARLAVVCLDRLGAEADPPANVAAAVSPDHLAYVMYTSGSTGMPKGVAVPHRAIVRLVRGGFAELGPAEVLLQLAPTSFDAATFEIWGALCTGGRLVIAPPGLLSPDEIGDLLARHGVTTLWLTAGLFHQLVEPGPERLGPVRQLLAGGDVLSVAHVRRALPAGLGRRLINGYGPTENTTFTCCESMLDGGDLAGSVPLGRPIAGTRVYLLDVDGGLAPIGVPGELCAGGAGLARGYVGRPERTAERFVPASGACAEAPGARLYRTGDLARYLPDGRIEFLGRLDQQVKIRGFRVEPGEIEAALLGHPAVRAAAVLAEVGAASYRQLVAYVEAGDVAPAELRSFLQASLPDYMVPAAFVLLPELPLTGNGKIDRRALAALASSAPPEASWTAPQTPTEEVLAAIWCEVLERERVGAGDDFFALGGHSLLAARVVSRVRETFAVELPLQGLFESPTLDSVAREIDALRAAEKGTAAPILRVVGARGGVVPLSFSQERLWFLDQLEPGRSTYNVPVAFRLAGRLDAAAFAGSLAEVVRRQGVLRTRFGHVLGQPSQIVEPAAEVPLRQVDLSCLAVGTREVELRRLVREEAGRPFNLLRGPLLRVALVHLGERDTALLATMHHIISDGWSMGVLVRELGTLYRAALSGEPSSLPDLVVEYADFAAWQRERLGAVLELELAYWREALGGISICELPTDRPRPVAPTWRGATRRQALAAPIGERLARLARGERATPFMTLLAVLVTLLHRTTGEDDLAVGSVVANRNRPEIEGLIGFFVNTLVLRTDTSGEPRFGELVERARDVALAAYAHQDLPFEKLVESLQPEREAGRTPFFQVMFTLQNAFTGTLDLPGLDAVPLAAELDTVKFDLIVTLAETGGGLSGSWAFNRDLFDPTTIERLAGHFAALARAVVDSGVERRISELPLLGEAERRQLVFEWNERADDPRGTVGTLFAEQMARAPEAVALVSAEGEMSYGELDRRAARLAARLAALRVRPEAAVGLCLPRSAAMVTATLAVVQAGGVYVPLDPDYPQERLAFLLRDAGIAVLVTEERLLAAFGEDDLAPLAVVCLDRPPAPAGRAGTAPSAPGPDHLAYLMYTSGSTGMPKGVAVPHRAIVRLVRGGFVHLGPEEVVLQLAPTSFDAATFEIWGALLNGGRLAIAPPGVLSPDEIGRLLARHGVTTLWLTAGLFHQLVESGPERLQPLRRLLAGGDVLSVGHVRRALAESGGRMRLINGYGPTENTTFTCCHPMDDGAELAGSVPLGRPIVGTRAYLLGVDGAPAPIGVPGELCAGGAGLARGYVGRPELTAERFVPASRGLAEAPGARLYRTGDLARYLPDGRIEFLGRIDQQVKIRGFRIEPGEIEAVLLGHESVRAAAVLPRFVTPGDRQLVAYVEADDLAPAELRAFLQASLPDYMVPNAFVVLPRLPLNPNGKVDRAELERIEPRPEARGGRRVRAPRTPVEEIVAGIWSELLRVERVGIDESFFDLGGHSLLATQVIARVGERFQVELSLMSLFESPTVASLAAEIEAAWSAGKALAVPPIDPLGEIAQAPLSFAQERLWFLDRLEPGRPTYNIPLAYRLRGAVDTAALRSSLAGIVRRHAALRTRFAVVAGASIQVVDPEAAPELGLLDLSGLPAAAREAELARRVREEARRPFDLSRGPLLRVMLVELGGGESSFLITMHHIVSDGWSMQVFVRELGALYRAALAGEPSPLAELPLQYADFAVWQRERLGTVLELELAYWSGALAGLATLDLPTDRPRPAAPTGRGAARPLALPPEVTAQLAQIAREEGATLFMTLLALLVVQLHRYSGQSDVAVGSVIANRNRPEIEDLIGFFVNTQVLRMDAAGEPSFRALLAQAREVALGAYVHQDLPFEKLVEALQPEREAGRTPLFQVMLTIQDGTQETLALPGVAVAPIEPEAETAKFDLSFFFAGAGAGLAGSLSFNRDLFDPSTAERMARQLAVLARAAMDPGGVDHRISELSLLGAAESWQLVQEWSAWAGDVPRERTVDRLFAEQVARAPQAVALVSADGEMSYAELARRAGRLAARLRGLGVGPEVAVGLCLPRSTAMIVATLAVLQAGGAYVPLDATYPRERLDFLLRDAQVAVLVTEEPLLAVFGGEEGLAGMAVVCLDRPGAEADPPVNVAAAVSPDHLAYVMYTSGSTGMPKGVAVPHRAIVRLVRGGFAALGPAEVLLQLAPTSFDAATFEIWGALCTGGRLVIAPPGLLSPDEIGDLLARHGVTTLWLTAGLFHQMVESRPERLGPVRQLLAGGDVLSVAHVRRALPAGLGRRLINGYGPTENTTFTCCESVLDGGDLAGPVPLGRPIAGTRVYLLDVDGGPAPIGVPGELCAGGAGLARGYVGQPERTAERFVPAPSGWAEAPGARLYRTGDLARYLPDGRIEFLGRIDQQVKIRGFRVEPGEVEVALLGHPAVRAAVVLPYVGAAGGRALVAYVDSVLVASAELRAFLQASLPDYMVPSAFVVLPKLPLTTNGKIDRQALARIEPEPGGPGRGLGGEPRTPIEEMLVGLWVDLLGVERVGVEDNFFDLGGHSLLATQVVARVSEQFRVELQVGALFEAPTVAGMAREIEAAWAAGRGVLVPPIDPLGEIAEAPLSFAQERLWFLDQLNPGSSTYNIPIGYRLRGELDVRSFRFSLAEIVRRHAALRTRFTFVAGQPLQVIAPAVELELPAIDLAAVGERERETELARLAREEALRPFDLARGPLLRTSLVRLAPGEAALLVTLHHIVSDGWSMGVFVRELGALYAAGRRGEPSPLPELPIQYADFAVWQRERLEAILDAELAYWRAALAGLATLELPTDRPRPLVQTARGGARPLRLAGPATVALARAGRAEGATLFMSLLAILTTLLNRYSGQTDVPVGTVLANRNHPEIGDLIGFFVNTLVLRADAAGEPTFRELLVRLRETALGAYAHQDLPFEKLVKALQPQRDASRTPLFQVMFTLQNAFEGSLTLAELTADPFLVELNATMFDLTVFLTGGEAGLAGALSFNRDLFDRSTIERLAGHFEALAAAVSDAATAERRLADLPWLAAPERHQLLVEGTAVERHAAEATLHGLFAEQAARSPRAVAVRSGDAELSYGELARRVARLAGLLAALGVGPEVPVALCCGRSPALVVAILAVLQAGGAYVPLDPAAPRERLALALADSGAPVVLADERSMAALPAPPAGVRIIRLDDSGAVAEAALPAKLVIPATSGNLAYVIFTSGSTGRPKGVAVRHAEVVRLLRSTEERFDFGPEDTWTMFHSYAFDFSVWELWGALLYGGRLVVVPYEVSRSPESFYRLLVEEQVTVLNQTPSAFRQLLWAEEAALARDGAASALALRWVIFGGEALELQALAPWFARHGEERPRLVNMYGITETTVHVTFRALQASDLASPASVIGRPLPDLAVYLLDATGQPVALGVVGEIFVGGAGLAAGYRGRPELTAERFVPDPFGPRAGGAPGSRLYRSGDLARYRLGRPGSLGDELEYLGRADQQVKIRGFRIELGEIEAGLAAHEAVREAVVLALAGTETGERRLAAYVVLAAPGEEAGTEPAGLRRFLKDRLPDYMLPASIVALPALPLTPNGKVDRRALAAITVERGGVGGIGVGTVPTPPSGAVEIALARIWEELLGTGPVGVDDDFFDLGGHSLLAVQLVSRVREELGVELPLRRLFETPTIAGLAREIEVAVELRGQAHRPGEEALVPLSPNGAGEPCFWVHPIGGSLFCYRDLARHLAPGQAVYGFQARGLAPGEVPRESVAAMAASYLEALRALQPGGPYRLGGWSFGGLVALEMASQLEAQGEEVAGLALIDPSTVPAGERAAPVDDLAALALLARDLGGLAGRPLAVAARDLAGLDEAGRFDLLVARTVAAGILPAGTAAADLRRLAWLVTAHLRAAYAYAPPRVQAPIRLVLPEERTAAAVDGWERTAGGGLEVHRLPGDHYSLLREPQVGRVAEILCAGFARPQEVRVERGSE